MLQSQQGIFVKLYENERYIQIGDHPNDCHMFIVTISLKSISNLNRLHAGAGPFHIQYTLFGNASHTRTLNQTSGGGSPGNANDIHPIREKIVIRFRSSLAALRLYFQKIFFIPVDVYSAADTLIGRVDIQVSAEMPDTADVQQFTEQYACVGHTHSAHGQCLIQGMAAGEPNDTFVDYEFQLAYEQVAEDAAQHELSGKLSVHTPLRFDDDSIGDAYESSARDSICSMTHLSEPPTVEYTEIDVLPGDEQLSTEEPIVERPETVHQTFSYKLRLQTIKFTKKPATGIWQLSLHHPKAHTPLTLTNVDVKEIGSDNIAMEDVDIQLYFSAEPEHILEVIGSEPCVLNIKGPRNLFTTAELNNGALLAQV